ncbi:MAG: caspase family protein [Cyclobacteriaceae bacterium]|nr:caspase family protein [Cyclobacteriaceae bacterium]
MRFILVSSLCLLLFNTSQAQYKLYEDGIKKYNEKNYYSAIELLSDFLTKPYRDKKFDADAFYWRGLASMKLNDYTDAVDDLKQSLALKHPNAGNINWFLAQSYDALGQHKEAIDAYTNALKILGNDKKKESQLLTERSAVYVKLNNTEAAGKDIQTAVASDPGNESQKKQVAVNESKEKNTSVPEKKTDTKVAETNKEVGKKPEQDKTSTPNQVAVTDTNPSKSIVSDRLSGKPSPRPIQSDKAQQEPQKKETIANARQDTKDNTINTKKEPEKKQTTPVTTPPAKQTQQTVSTPAKEPTLRDLYNDEKRYALVIGNSAYSKQIGVLRNPVNDATDFAATLRNMNFDVTLITNASYGKIRAEMMKFRAKLNEGEPDKTVGLFYYAGHGLQYDSENYIVPVDAELHFVDDIPRYCFPIQRMVLTQMEMTNSRMNIVILDACRNNPFPSINRSLGEQGLGEIKKARGAFIAYATSPGSVAADGSGRNGLYTQELIKAMNKPNRTIEQVFKEVRANVLKQSHERQNPWENSNIVGDFYFKFD